MVTMDTRGTTAVAMVTKAIFRKQLFLVTNLFLGGVIHPSPLLLTSSNVTQSVSWQVNREVLH